MTFKRPPPPQGVQRRAPLTVVEGGGHDGCDGIVTTTDEQGNEWCTRCPVCNLRGERDNG